MEEKNEMTLQGHKNRVLFKAILLGAIIIGGVVLLSKQKKGKLLI